MGGFILGSIFNAGGYFRTDRYTLVCVSFSASLSSSILNLIWPWECSRFPNIGLSLWCLYYFHTRVCSQMTSGGDFCNIGISKLICEANRWTDSCVIRFLPEGRSKETNILPLYGSAKYTTILCFSIRGSDSRVPVLSCTWETVFAVLGNHSFGVCFHFVTSEIT